MGDGGGGSNIFSLCVSSHLDEGRPHLPTGVPHQVLTGGTPILPDGWYPIHFLAGGYPRVHPIETGWGTPPRDWWGTSLETGWWYPPPHPLRLDRVPGPRTTRGTPTGTAWRVLLRGGRYASCVHAGGLYFVINFPKLFTFCN